VNFGGQKKKVDPGTTQELRNEQTNCLQMRINSADVNTADLLVAGSHGRV
jgi:hypothetical protein